jgi:hypothetical protein
MQIGHTSTAGSATRNWRRWGNKSVNRTHKSATINHTIMIQNMHRLVEVIHVCMCYTFTHTQHNAGGCFCYPQTHILCTRTHTHNDLSRTPDRVRLVRARTCVRIEQQKLFDQRIPHVSVPVQVTDSRPKQRRVLMDTRHAEGTSQSQFLDTNNHVGITGFVCVYTFTYHTPSPHYDYMLCIICEQVRCGGVQHAPSHPSSVSLHNNST